MSADQPWARAHDAANPWGLSPRQVQTLRALVATGVNKRAARAMGVEVSTVMRQTELARRKMGMSGAMLYLFAFDRWDQKELAAAGPAP